MSVDKTDFGLVLYNHANFNRLEETSSYWSVKQILVFLCFSLVNQRHTSCITVYNRTVTNIENTVRAVHSCNSWLLARSSPSSRHDITSEAMNDMKMVYNGPMPILLAPLEPLADSYHEKNSFWPQAIMGVVR